MIILYKHFYFSVVVICLLSLVFFHNFNYSQFALIFSFHFCPLLINLMGTLCRNGVAISGAFGCPKKIGFIRALHSSFGSNNTSGGKVKYAFPVIPRNSHGHPEFMDMAARSGGAEPMLTLEQDNLKEATQKPKEEQKPPQWYYTSGVIKHFASMLAIRKYLSKELVKNIERSADKLYYHCANHYDFASLHKEFGLPDNFFAWYRLTLLHVWMMLTRLQQSMEIYAYCVYRRHLITALHTDMAERYRLIFSKNKYATLKRHSKYKELYNGVFMSSMFEYDEGFLCDDKVFAGAVWRSLFVQDPNLDIIHLNKAVRYIRETMHFLDGLDANQLLNDGLDRWAPADKISEEQKQRTQQL